MPSGTQSDPVSGKRLWTGRILSGLSAALLAAGGVMNVIKAPAAVEGATQLGYPESSIARIGAALLASTLLYVIPRTSILGAILLTGYLGGAVATHVRAGHPMFSQGLIPVYFAVVIWAGLCLRNNGLWTLIASRHD